jgi:hypothetical protein
MIILQSRDPFPPPRRLIRELGVKGNTRQTKMSKHIRAIGFD